MPNEVVGFKINGSTYNYDHEHLANLPTIDATPTANSTNAVQSGGVKSALDGLQAEIPIVDPVPTQGSNNAVSSGGVWSTIDGVKTGLADVYTILPEDLSENYINHYYIPISTSTELGTVISLEPSANANLAYQIIECSGGEYFRLTGRSVSGMAGFAFVDSENALIYKSGIIYTNVEYTAPTAGKLIVNINQLADYEIIRGRNTIDIIKENIGEIPVTMRLTVVAGLWTVNGSANTGSTYRRTLDSVLYRQGTKFTIYASAGGANSALITEWDAEGNFIQTLVASSNYETATVYTLDHDAYLRFSYRNANGFSGTMLLPSINTAVGTGADAKQYAEINLYEWERVLNSVCCIGDSLTRGAYFVNGRKGVSIDQNYPYFFGKQTGLTVQNEGMGGSSPSSRWSYFSTYDFTPYNAFFIWWGTNGGLTDTLETDGVIDSEGNLIADYTTYADTNTGDYCKTIGKIISQVPHAKIFLATIFTTSAAGGESATNAVIEKIAALYPNHVMGIVDCNNGTLYTLAAKKLTPPWVHIDNVTHFSMVGNYYLAVHWIKEVRKIISANPRRFEDIMEDILG